jgi:battenin
LLQLPAIFQAINAAFLSFVAVYDFIPSIYVIFAIIFWEGLLGGSIYVNTFYLMSQKFRGEEKEFCLGK